MEISKLPLHGAGGLAPENYIEDMTPVEFEQTVRDHIAALGEGLLDLNVAHDMRLVGSDGIYQIDVLASYTALGVKMMVLIECKHYTSSVPREKVQVLYDKIRSVGAHKGILFSTAGFQSSAIEYALRHKIALIRMLNSGFERITNTLKKDDMKAPFATAGPAVIGEFIGTNGRYFVKPGKIGPLVNFLVEAG